MVTLWSIANACGGGGGMKRPTGHTTGNTRSAGQSQFLVCLAAVENERGGRWKPWGVQTLKEVRRTRMGWTRNKGRRRNKSRAATLHASRDHTRLNSVVMAIV